MVEEVGEVPGGDVHTADPFRKRRRMIGVGARQRSKHAGRGPTGKPPRSYLLKDFLREGLDKTKTPCNPARVPSEQTGHPGLRHLMAAGELPDEGSLFHHIPSSLTADREQSQQGLVFPAVPVLDQDRVPFAELERRHPPVTVNEHTGRDGDNGHDLPPLLDGGGKADQGLFCHYPRVGVARIDLGDLQLHGLYRVSVQHRMKRFAHRGDSTFISGRLE